MLKMAFTYTTVHNFVKNVVQPHIVNVKDLLEASISDLKKYLIDKIEDLEDRLTNYIDTAIAYVISLFKNRPELPVGYISAYYGRLDSSNTHPIINDKIYLDWYICDGRNGTIDLRDKFIVGANGNLGNSLGSDSHNHNISVSISGSIQSTSLTVTQIPAHQHRFSDRHTGVGPSGSDKWPGAGRAPVIASIYVSSGECTLATTTYYTYGDLTYHDTESVGSGASHTHGHSISGSGSSGYTSNIPPCVALYYIMYKK